MIGLLVIVMAVGVCIGLAISNKGDPASSASVEQCSFCYDGSTPPNLEMLQIEDDFYEGTISCTEFRVKQIQLNSTDMNCAWGQVLAYGACECPTLPPPPEDARCTPCTGGEVPFGSDCDDLHTMVLFMAEILPIVPCKEFASMYTYEGGCSCQAV